MAKLSARGRTIVADATKTVKSEGLDGRAIELHRRLMSDRVVLRKIVDRWTVRGKLKPTTTPEQWIAGMRSAGWDVTAQ
jgi:hypothetical protein